MLAVLRDQYEPAFFVAGHCHRLALAVFESAGRTGRLLACIRHQVDAASGAVRMRTYSHMLYEAPDRTRWDIEGPGADASWMSPFNSETPDADNFLSEFHWLALPPEAVASFVIEWGACLTAAWWTPSK